MNEGLIDLLAGLRRPPQAVELAWLACLWDMAEAGEAAAAPLAGTAAGRAALGRGGGGDITVEIDRAAEEAMLSVLTAQAPEEFYLVSEEAGETGPPDGSAPWRVLVDPVDGSLNAKRGLAPYCAALGVADGHTLGDVRIGVVADYSSGARYAALRGAGAVSNRNIEGYSSAGTVELILTEMGRPECAVFSFRQMGVLAGWATDVGWDTRPGGMQDYRVRQIGSLALSLCHTAFAIADVVLCPAPSRSVDIAAGLLMLREQGGDAASLDGQDLWAQPLDLQRRTPFLGWRPGMDGFRIMERGRRLWSLAFPDPRAG